MTGGLFRFIEIQAPMVAKVFVSLRRVAQATKGNKKGGPEAARFVTLWPDQKE
jgi:hypothetical protein